MGNERGGDEAAASTPEGERWLTVKRGGLIALVALVGIGVATKDQWDWMLADGDAKTVSAVAPVLDDLDPDAETLYRIAPSNGSSVSYEVTERLAGTTKTARGTTEVLAGDIAINRDDPSDSRIGTIMINVEMFESDSALRDKRIRHDFLESTHFPMAKFDATSIDGLPTTIENGVESEIIVSGDLTLKETTAPVTFSGTVSLDDDTLRATMTGTVLMSTFDVGPIHVAGLAHTEDEVTFTLDLAADQTDIDANPASDDALLATAGTPEFTDGEFSSTVQPIFEAKCVSCHSEGGPGWSTVEMDTAGQVAALAQDMALVTESRFMPPWPASDLGLAFKHDFSLTDEEIATIAAWAADGGGLDVDPDTPLTPDEPPFEPIERDQVIPSRGEYIGDLAVKDDYRCLIHEVADPEGDGEWVTGLGFEPDEDEVVHHSIVYKAPAAALAEANELDMSDGRPGWQCFGRANMQTPGVVSIGGWAPGQQASTYPDGVGIYLAPGEFLVNQIHYHFDHTTPADQSVLVLDTLSSEELAARDEPMTAIAGRSYLTPAEGPCTPEEEGPLCDRDAVLEEIAQKYGGGAQFIPDALLRRCGGTVDDFDDLDGTKFYSSCDLPAADFGRLHSVLGHMHEFGAAYRMTLNPDTPDEKILLDIPSWSFEWQLYYVPEEDLRIEPGDMIRFECTWDRTNAAMPEPRYITWNEGTVDEMCFSSVSVIPDLNVEGLPNNITR